MLTSEDRTILWRRLDAPGHDACRLDRTDTEWRLAGTAAFLHKGVAAQLAYEAVCDDAWQTKTGNVRGWIGAERVEYVITRSRAGVWALNGREVSGLEGCVDLDFGFTPATNLIQIRRLDLANGGAADAPAAWLDVSTGTLEILPQRYERSGETAYRYEAPSVGYADLLEVEPSGFVRRYPGLWEAESASASAPDQTR